MIWGEEDIQFSRKKIFREKGMVNVDKGTEGRGMQNNDFCRCVSQGWTNFQTF
jgi:hypothetical protein